MLLLTCPCGVDFETYPSRVKQGRGRYCSRGCMYHYRVRPKGLKYSVVKDNPTSFRPGDEPWDKGLHRPDMYAQNPAYSSIHKWVRQWAVDPGCCEQCESTEDLQWSNKSGDYLRDLSDWQRLCRRCHFRYDRATGIWGKATAKFGGAL